MDVLSDLVLPDKTRVFDSLPLHGGRSLGELACTIQFKELKNCNLSFVRTATEGWQDGQFSIYGGNVDMQLLSYIDSVFAMIRPFGTIEYKNAFLLADYVENELPTCRHFGKCEKFKITRGCLPWAIREEDLRKAITLQEACTLLKNTLDPQKYRFHREPVHDWDRSSPTQYVASDREYVALWRTRQMEELASAVYRKILSDKALQPNFYDDATIESFWKKSDYEIYSSFGNVCDISQLKIVKEYDAYGRADSSEWPKTLLQNLQQKA